MNRHDPVHRFAAAAMLGLLLLGGCDNKPQSNLPTIQMQLGNKSFTLEVADSTATRTYGLMRRDSMPPDHGMLFVFADEEERGFWMKNTRIPLDIIFVDGGGKVLSISRMEPYDERGTGSGGMAKCAIELNAGQAETTGIKVGDVLQIPDAAKNAKADP